MRVTISRGERSVADLFGFKVVRIDKMGASWIQRSSELCSSALQHVGDLGSLGGYQFEQLCPQYAVMHAFADPDLHVARLHTS